MSEEWKGITVSSKFISIPVGKGDAFYLERNGKCLLFDGGQATYSLPALIRQYTNCLKFDVVVCSHNDADHAKGLIGLLEDPSISISEIWLPGRWIEGLSRIVENEEKFFLELYRECLKRPFESLDDMSNAELIDNERLDHEVIEIEFLESRFEELRCFPAVDLLEDFSPMYRWPMEQFVFEAIEAADRIKKIAALGVGRGCKIRWFDFDTFSKSKSPSGGESWLKPLNSVEITVQKKSRRTSLQLLALSVSNRESLAFVSNINNEPSVVFTADSDLDGVQLPILSNPITTAPHHGSEANDNVYGIASLKSSIWVRSDMWSSKRPSMVYRKLSAKVCTRCRNRKQHQAPSFYSLNNVWKSHSTSFCTC